LAENGNGSLNLPTLNINSVAAMINKFGPWVPFTAFLIWQMTQGFGGKLDAISARIEAHENSAAIARQQVVQELQLLQRLVSIAQANCVNQAKDETGRNRCFQ
jgi:hypothetical protein